MTISNDLRKRVIEDVFNHIGTLTDAVLIASSHWRVNERSIWRWINHKTHSGRIYAIRKRGKKRSYVLPQRHIEFLIEHLRTVDAELYEDEMALLLHDTFDIWYTISQIRSALSRNKMTSKVISRIAQEQQADQRLEFRNLIAGVKAIQIVAVDESHLNKKEARRRRGRSTRGQPAFRRQAGVRGLNEISSSICAVTIDGIISATAYEDIVDGETFLDNLVTRILPLMESYPNPRSVLLLDNASPHMKADIYAAINEHKPGVIIFWLPPYSYDYNPIEICFHLGKSKLRRNYHVHDGNPDVILCREFEKAMLTCCTPNDACNLFEKCHIKVTDEERSYVNL